MYVYEHVYAYADVHAHAHAHASWVDVYVLATVHVDNCVKVSQPWI